MDFILVCTHSPEQDSMINVHQICLYVTTRNDRCANYMYTIRGNAHSNSIKLLEQKCQHSKRWLSCRCLCPKEKSGDSFKKNIWVLCWTEADKRQWVLHCARLLLVPPGTCISLFEGWTHQVQVHVSPFQGLRKYKQDKCRQNWSGLKMHKWHMSSKDPRAV